MMMSKGNNNFMLIILPSSLYKTNKRENHPLNAVIPYDETKNDV